MSDAPVEKKLPVRNLERVGNTETFNTFELAVKAAKRKAYARDVENIPKVKIFARNNGTFDVVWYRRVGTVATKVAQAPKKASEVVEKPVHGLKSKDRKKNPKKAR